MLPLQSLRRSYSTMPALVPVPTAAAPSSFALVPLVAFPLLPHCRTTMALSSATLTTSPGPTDVPYRSLKLTCFLGSHAWGVV